MRKPHANRKQTVFIDNFKSDLKFGNKSKHFSHENQKNKQFYHLKLFYWIDFIWFDFFLHSKSLIAILHQKWECSKCVYNFDR